MTEVRFEVLASNFGTGRIPFKVVGGGGDRHMPHVHCELREPRLHVDALAIPAQKCLLGKRMAKIVNVWHASIAASYIRNPESFGDFCGKSSRTIAAKDIGTVA